VEDSGLAASAPQVQSWPLAGAAFSVPSAVNPTTSAMLSGLSAGSASRDLAMSVPAFRQGVNMIAGTCGTFPVRVTSSDNTPLAVPVILSQPDRDEPSSVTWTKVYADLVLYPYAWLLVTERLADGFPLHGVHLPAEQVQIHDQRVLWRGADVTANAIRFDSPTAPGALHEGRRILETSILIEEATRRFARMEVPSGHLKQTGGPELLQSEVEQLLTGWDAARANRATAFLSGTVDYQTTSFDPAALQLVEARNANAVDIARLLNLPPTFVNAETGGSLTYSTVESQGRALLNSSLVPYLSAWANRVSMGDVTPRGQYAQHNTDAFLRGDLPARSQAYSVLLASGVVSVNEVRKWEGLPPIAEPSPDPAPEPAPDVEDNTQ
jgi:Phage portal protein